MGSGGAGSSSNPSFSKPHALSPAPKILLAKPGIVPAVGNFSRAPGDDETGAHRFRVPAISSLNLLSDTWEFYIDRFLPFLTENTDFTVVGVIGPTGTGKSTILNELYGFDASFPGMLPPFNVQSEENRAMAKHCSSGIEPRVTADRIILLDTQPVFSASGLADMMKPDASMVSVIRGENLSAELAQEIMAIQLGVLLASICNVLLVVSDGINDDRMWRLLLTVDLLKHGMPDPSLLSQGPGVGHEKDSKDKILGGQEFMAIPVFVHTKVQPQDCGPTSFARLKKGLNLYFRSASFMKVKASDAKLPLQALNSLPTIDSMSLSPVLIPLHSKTGSQRVAYESYDLALRKLRDQVLSMKCFGFPKTISERDWLKNSAKIWELVKSSSLISDYCQTLLNSGMFRK